MLKDEIILSLKWNDGLKLAQNVVLNDVRETVKSRWKILYKVLREEDSYDSLLDIYPYPTLIKLKYFLGGIHHYVTLVGKLILTEIFLFPFPHSW